MIRPIREQPTAGQESAWDFPRPSIAQPVSSRLRVVFDGRALAETAQAIRTVETSHPPTYYFPPGDVDMRLLLPNGRRSFCEWKGEARYFDVATDARVASAAAWSYPAPTEAFRSLQDYIAFYPGMMDFCTVDGETVVPQPGGFYGGWITSAVAGPFKGSPGTQGW